MNGINYSILLGNSGLFSNQSGTVSEDILKGTSTVGANKNVSSKKSNDAKQINADQDTYESGQTRNVKAGYDKPKSVKASKEHEYKALDADGIQEGVELSDAAKDLLAELREKYGNMDFAVAKWSTDEEQEYYASLSSKEYSVLINPELLEQMASDESVREQYESILSGADENFETLKEELGEDADKVTGFSITIDQNGKVSYAVKLLQDMAESSAAKAKEKKTNTTEEKQQERIKERRAERKKAEEERPEKIEADSIDELIAAIKNKLHPEEETEELSITQTVEDAETAAGQVTAE